MYWKLFFFKKKKKMKINSRALFHARYNEGSEATLELRNDPLHVLNVPPLLDKKSFSMQLRLFFPSCSQLLRQ